MKGMAQETIHSFKVGERVKVKPEFDELLKLLGKPTNPGTVISLSESDSSVAIVAEDEDGIEAGGSSAPYSMHELELL